jgi:hypothetical protein
MREDRPELLPGSQLFARSLVIRRSECDPGARSAHRPSRGVLVQVGLSNDRARVLGVLLRLGAIAASRCDQGTLGG